MEQVSGKMPEVFALDIVAGNGVPFRVLLITGPDGAPNKHRVASHPTVEFHDRRFPRLTGGYHPGFSEHGQFTGGYYALEDMLLTRNYSRGLVLDGGEPDWRMDALSMTHVASWLDQMSTQLGIS